MQASDVNRLVCVPGIILQAQRSRPKAVTVRIQCQRCGNEQDLPVAPGFGGASLPRTCSSNQGMGGAPSAIDGGAAAAAGAGAMPGGGGGGPGTGGGGGGGGSGCGLDPYLVLTDQCRFVDQQTLKLQEAPETVPTGEMPRSLQLHVERFLADQASPGTRVSAIGVVSVTGAPGKRERGSGGGGSGAAMGPAVRAPYVRVVGIVRDTEGAGRTASSFSPAETQVLQSLARLPNIYERLADSIAPSISGDYTADIKKAILCLLVAGSRKLLPDGLRLRGDINVLMLGDPSTAKSQFLKFVERVAPVGVYTSGKGSSAAGLTASVLKDKGGDFYLEAGAMVLADGGVVCIDEFDKMREEDRVAIHEAMEQQTISVAKAGITTILNSRSAVLAAANPVYGRYDDTKSAAENIDLLPTILSRFDLIFIVRDIRDERRDREIAKHVMRVHINAGAGVDAAAGSILDDGLGASAAAAAAASAAGATRSNSAAAAVGGGDIDLPTLKRYITFVRSKCAPRLSADADAFLCAKYVEIRKESRRREADARSAELATNEEHGVIPITVRQLEALVRITEAVAKCSLSKEATLTHAEEALRLFRVSTLDAAASGLSTLEGNMTEDGRKRILMIEGRIQRALPVGSAVPTALLKENLLRAGFKEGDVNMALKIMERRDEIRLINERRTLRRIR
jgi:DNA replication licensing factor MCM5